MSVRTALIGAGAGLLLAAVIGAAWRTHGAAQYRAGYAQAKTDAAIAAAALSEGIQYERDRADAIHRGAVLAREAAQRDFVAARSQLDGLLRAHGRDPANPRARGRPDEAGPDWIGGFGACYAEYADLAADAAKWADQVNGLQGYVRAFQRYGKPVR